MNSGHIVLDNINVPPPVNGANDTADFRAYCLNPGMPPNFHARLCLCMHPGNNVCGSI